MSVRGSSQTKRKKPVERERCLFCGEPRSDEELALQKEHGALSCPQCGRDGCFECMPAGRGCMCPECEEGAAE